MKIYRFGFAAIVFGILAASCGGGGNGQSDSTAEKSLAQGVYANNIVYDNGFELLQFVQQTIVLENGEIFVVYGNQYNDVFYVDGFLHGTGVINSTTHEFHSDDLNDYFYRNKAVEAVYKGSLVAQFSAGIYFNGTADQSDSVINFTGNSPSITSYKYEMRAELARIAGKWELKDLLAEQLTVSISNTGTFTGTYQNGCSISGSLKPRSSGKNIFNATFTYGSYPCTHPNRKFSGIAINYMTAMQPGSLIIAGVTADRSQGIALFSAR